MGNTHDHHAPGATHEAVALDPEHDIDARSATIWVLCGTIVLFFSLWIMLPIFTRVLEEEQARKVDQMKVGKIASDELATVLDAQHQFLNGANPTHKTIEQTMKEIASGK